MRVLRRGLCHAVASILLLGCAGAADDEFSEDEFESEAQAALAAPATARQWNFNAGLEGWSLTHAVGGNVNGGRLNVSVNNSDPYIVSPGGLGIDGRKYGAVRFVMQNGTSDSKAALYFRKKGENAWHFQAFPMKAKAGSLDTYVVDLRNNSAWQGTIEQLRLDPGNGAKGTVAIDSIAVMSGLAETFPGWSYLDNGTVRVGVDLNRGGGVGYMAQSATGKNLLNTADNGRYLQQSYYGDDIGGHWGKRPWVFNPVQGGSSQGHVSSIKASSNDGKSIYVKTIPKDWGGGAEDTPCVMEEWITLEKALVRLQFRFTYNGNRSFSSKSQEVPAFFVDRSLEKLTRYDGKWPWTYGTVVSAAPPKLQPNLVPSSFNFTENWAAYLNGQNWGIGLYNKKVKNGVSYLVGDNVPNPNGETAYFAFTDKFALTPGKVYDYVVYARIGTLNDIRNDFYALHAAGH